MAGSGQTGGGNIYNQSANAMRGAMGGTAAIGAQTGPQGFQSGVGGYMNPYQDQVINRTMGALDRQRQMTLNNVGAQASAANAFGGSRHGIVEAETNRGYADTMADTTANLYNTGFQNSAQNMFQDRSMGLSAAGQLAGMGGQAFGMGQEINQNMGQQGAQQQALVQQIMNQARQMFGGYAGAPGQSLQYPLAAIGGVPTPQSQTTTQKPGLMNYLALGLGLI